MEVIVVKNEISVVERLWAAIESSANVAIQDRSVFRVGLSGGSLINYMAKGAEHAKTDWSKWQLYFCDERFVDENSDDSTFGQYKKLFMPKTKLTEAQFVTINRTLTLNECAADYARQILEKYDCQKSEVPQFDLLLLGMGPDGHTCSLFPGHPLLNEKSCLVAPINDSPKPPPERITMTFPLINNAKMCMFALSGKGKAEIIKRVLEDKEPLPAGLVKPSGSGKLVWLLDEDAASHL